jgi:hypothetical protein
VFGLAEDGVNKSTVATQGDAQAGSATKDGSGSATDGRMFGGRRSVDERVFDAERTLEGDEGGVGEIGSGPDEPRRSDHAFFDGIANRSESLTNRPAGSNRYSFA